MRLRTSYQKEIDTFIKLISSEDYNIRTATKGALTQARSKLNPWAFRRLNEVAVKVRINLDPKQMLKAV